MLEWGLIWGADSPRDSELRIIRVKTEYVNGDFNKPVSVANAFNGYAWLRRPLTSVIDPGVYTIGVDGGLVSKDDYRGTYPDLELKLPNFQKMTHIKTLSIEELQEMSFCLQQMKEIECVTAYMTREGLYSNDWNFKDDDDEPPIVAYERDWFKSLPEDTLSFRVSHLQLAISEMTYYQGNEILLMSPQSDEEVIVIGTNPFSCAVIAANRSRL